jgi:hypothetical protein
MLGCHVSEREMRREEMEHEEDLVVQERHQDNMEVFIQFEYLGDVSVLHSLPSNAFVNNFLSFNWQCLFCSTVPLEDVFYILCRGERRREGDDSVLSQGTGLD